MLCDFARETDRRARNIDENSDLGAVNVVGDSAFASILAKRRIDMFSPIASDQRLARVFDRGSAKRVDDRGRHVRRVLFRDEVRQRSGELQEILVLGDKIGLAVDLDDRTQPGVGRHVDRDDALGRGAGRSLGRLVAEPDAQELLGFGLIALRLDPAPSCTPSSARRSCRADP